MRSSLLASLLLVLVCVLPASATIAVSSPNNNSTVGSSVRIAASATTPCAKGIASMGIYVDNVLRYTVVGTKLDTAVSVTPGPHLIVVTEWNYCGGSSTATLNVTYPTTAGITVNSPANNSTVGTPAMFVATATTSCPHGVAAMGVYANDKLLYTVAGATLNAPITLGLGQQNTVVQEWDNCGGSAKTPVKVTVTGTTLKNLQAAPGWHQWGQLPPVYDICDAPCPGVTWSMKQNQKSLSMSGNATQFNLGGSVPYSAVLFSNPVLGQGNKMGLTDDNHTLLPTLNNFIYDADVYITNWNITQLQEFDVNMYAGGIGMEWGTECNHLNGNVWDYWNNVEAKWVPTSIPCTMKTGWNHITLQVQRKPNNDLLYQSVAVNGVVYPMNITVAPKKIPVGWWGMTINYQIGGNYQIAANTTYVDNLHFTYW